MVDLFTISHGFRSSLTQARHMRLRIVLAGWAMVGVCSALIALSVQAHPLVGPDAGPLAIAPVSRLGLDGDRYLPAAGLNETIIGIPVDASGKVVLETT